MKTHMSRPEFIALIAMMFATIAFSIDSMLPALPEIGRELSPENVNRAQMLISAFVLGMGAGTFFTGPLSDAFGRKPVILAGAATYIVAAALAWWSDSLEVVLAARLLQGIGAAGPRVVALAVVRDLYSGREMAKTVSFAMMIFTIFPAFAPLMGQGIIALTGWRGIFLAFILFSLISVFWLGLRLPETLAPENRRPMRLPLMIAALREMAGHPTVRLSILVQTLCLASMFVMILTVQPAYDVIFGEAENFPIYFGAIALFSGSASLLNAAIVVRVGMRRIVTWALAAQIAMTLVMLVIAALSGMHPRILFWGFVLWQTVVFFFGGMLMGNLNAIAMEPMGHIAGMAASIMGALSTVGAAVLSTPVGMVFDGTLRPMTAGVLIFSAIAFGLMLIMGRLERRQEQ
ncbi:multidrug effflux MFS transporter [Pseudodonghicola flavimaris]|uniref:Multidrug effflux MFS transporter n=1 Tax=Pseudodonghicola flavimaris TaxID=3050036 RepID=A0ABT7F1G9_9RHOB|nr:multidrug effflux MFS transporter [Pseudodonghicola flavimaris]MDK3018443.1 multidrug effflux MFS transporter [Pseudodonghicola flavimaris]